MRRRILQTLPVLFMVSFAVFMMVRLIPGDPAAVMAGPGARTEDIERVRENLGLDQPLLVQYRDYIGNVLRGDFGTSLSTNRPVWQEILQRVPASVQLALGSMALALVFGLGFGVAAAYFVGRWPDRLVSFVSMAAISIPTFWTALVFILVFAITIGWFPVGGRESELSLVLPTITLAIPQFAIASRLIRGAFIEILQQDYIQTARHKGLSEARVLLRHAMPNGLITVLTFAGIQLGHLLAGAVVVEVIFSWPGLGRLAVDSLLRRDLPTVQAVVLLFAVMTTIINLSADLLYAAIDPRIGASDHRIRAARSLQV
jgi:glutathione transport system permease protein